jgi:TonB family protein
MMIVRFVSMALVIGALLSLAAFATERLLRIWNGQARWVWSATMVLTALVPLMTVAQMLGWVPRSDDWSAVRAVILPVANVVVPTTPESARTQLEIAVALGWALLSFAVIARFVGGARRLRQRRSAWRTSVVDGNEVLVSADCGPAVIGFRDPVIVLPEWVLDLDRSLRALILRHESEHLDRGDPRVLMGSLAIAALFPWNLTMWFQLHRLRRAMELDCDARVLRAYPDTRRYGSLLLAVAQRADRSGLFAAAFMNPNSLLATRIIALRHRLPRHRVARSLALAGCALAATIIACQVDAGSSPNEKPIVMDADKPYFEFQVEQPVVPAEGSPSPRYPDLLRQAKIEGEVFAQFVVGPDGRADVESFKVLKSTHDLFTKSVLMALPQMRFKPALVGGRPVKQLVQQPFTYSMSR